MNAKLTNLATTHYIFLVRSLVVILGSIAVWWGIAGFPVFWQVSSTERIANRIIARDPFKAETLAAQIPIIESIEKSAYCRPAALRSAAIIQLRMMEASASTGNRERVDAHLTSLGNVIRSSLSCAPADPFLWLVLFWVESSENGSKTDYLKYLRMSYRLGSNEGWIAVTRNRVAFANFQQLPPDLGEITINEFITLLESGFIEPAAEIFIGPAWPERELILSYLTRVFDQNRKLFEDALYRRGYDINVPGIARRDLRPWHRP
jgi:hypothetical protein